MRTAPGPRRRGFCAAAAWAALALPPGREARAQTEPLRRAIPSTGERIPAVGLGTWLTFDFVPSEAARLARSAEVLQRFLAGGGTLVDSSPMYGHAEAVMGELVPRPPGGVFAATKVWTPSDAYGPVQMRRSLGLWRRTQVDLMQVHNLLNWRGHLPLLREWKAQGRTRYVGVTTSHGRAHEELAAILRREPLDFVQLTYHPLDRSAEPLIALAAERGVAVIVNRPFDGGHLLSRLARRPLPALARELQCGSWAELALKWTLSNPAVTCAIPATTDPAHAAQNVAAMHGPLPTPAQRDALGRLLAA